MEDQVKALNAQ
ncbi:Hypothetical protein EIN_421170, partial [Entamoeba invadens IP1]